jgi:hypothetical protein
MYPVPTQILAEASFFHFFFCIARRDTSTSTQVTQHQLARLRPPLIQGGQWGDEFSSCTRRGPCLSPERPRPPHHIPGLWKRSRPENDTRGVPHGTKHLNTEILVAQSAKYGAQDGVHACSCGCEGVFEMRLPQRAHGIDDRMAMLEKASGCADKELLNACLFQS